MGHTLYEERKAIEENECDDLYFEMKIKLPFSCFERPVQVKRGRDMVDVDTFRFKHDKYDLRQEGVRYLGAFIELSSLNKNSLRTNGYIDGRSGDTRK